LFPGRVIANRYRVVRVLGRGGMGVVSEVEQLDTGEHFAIKFLREDVDSDMQPNARFLREAKLATRLKSPHTCRVVTIGEWELGPYIVMELLEGRPLSTILERGRRLEVAQAARIAYEMCVALTEAHELGIVHRDVKPGNVYLAKGPTATVTTKVLDFGVAKIPSSVVTRHGEHSLTDASTLLGTPSYVAPEQLINSKLVDPRADVWAVGVMLYEMLAGQLPFSSPLIPKLLVMIAREEPAPLATLVPELPQGLVEVVHRCLLKDPSQRCANAGTLAQALLPWLDNSDALLVPLLRMPTTRPSLRPSELPPSKPAPLGSCAPGNSDSLGPHTTSHLGKHLRLRAARVRYAVAGALLGMLAAGGYLWGHSPATPPSAPAIAPAKVSASSPTRQLLLLADPLHARIELDGAAVKANPANLTIVDDGQPHQLVISAPGFITERRTLHFDVNHHLTVFLRPEPMNAQRPAATFPQKVRVPAGPARSTATATPAPKEGKMRQLDRLNPF
jgi:eukaryotic-like serine/threonine-protein kinase